MSQQDQSLIGRLAVHYKMITMDQLAAATREQSRQGAGKLLGDLLVEKGLLRPAQLSQLLKVQQQVQAKQQALTTAGKGSPEAGTRGEGAGRPAPPPAPAEPRPAAPTVAKEPQAAEKPRPQASPTAEPSRAPAGGVQRAPSDPKAE